MKKILFLSCLVLTGLITNAQTSYISGGTSATSLVCQRNTYTLWNLDTLGMSGLSSGTNALYFYGESKTITITTNLSLQIQGVLGSKQADSAATGGIFIWGSNDNVTWVRVPLSSSLSNVTTPSNATITFGRTTSPVQVSSGTWPVLTQPAFAGTGIGVNAVTSNDTVAVATTYQSSSANGILPFTVNIERPQYTYYKLGVQLSSTATSAKWHTYTWFFRYYTRKPY